MTAGLGFLHIAGRMKFVRSLIASCLFAGIAALAWRQEATPATPAPATTVSRYLAIIDRAG